MAQYFIAVDGQQQGPFGLAEIQARGLSPDDLVWNEGMTDWLPAKSVAELSSAVRTARPLANPSPAYPPQASYPRPMQQRPVPPPAYAPQPAPYPPPQPYHPPQTYPPAAHPQQGYVQQGYAPPMYPPQGYAQAQPAVHIHNHGTQPVYYVTRPTIPSKNTGVAFLLTFFFGPFGMFYSTIGGGIVMLLLMVILGTVTFGAAVPFLWLICIIWGCVSAANAPRF